MISAPCLRTRQRATLKVLEVEQTTAGAEQPAGMAGGVTLFAEVLVGFVR